jgi:hypothetical protein
MLRNKRTASNFTIQSAGKGTGDSDVHTAPIFRDCLTIKYINWIEFLCYSNEINISLEVLKVSEFLCYSNEIDISLEVLKISEFLCYSNEIDISIEVLKISVRGVASQGFDACVQVTIKLQLLSFSSLLRSNWTQIAACNGTTVCLSPFSWSIALLIAMIMTNSIH